MLKNIMIRSLRDEFKRPLLAPWLPSSPRLLNGISPLSTNVLTPEITFFTNDERSRSKIRDLSVYSSEGRPLCVILCWLMAKPNSVLKYTKFYLDQGFDVLKVRITALQFLLPASVDPLVNTDVLPILKASDHQQKLIHGFSVGAYVFSRMMRQIKDDRLGRYDDLKKSFKGQIWDSFADVNGLSVGVSSSISESPIIQQGVQRYVNFHEKAFHNISTKYYLRGSEDYYNNPLEVPALFFYSEIDPISTFDRNEAVQKEWIKRGVQCTKKTWKDSQHVGHMRAHPHEYQASLKAFLKTTGIVTNKGTVGHSHCLDDILNNNEIRSTETGARVPLAGS